MRPDEDVFLEGLYKEFFVKLWNYAVAALGDSEQAAEVVQDTFHEAVKHIDVLMDHENPKGWLMITLKNKIKHSRRDLNRYVLHFVSLDSDIQFEDPVLAVVDENLSNTRDVIEEIKTVLSSEEWTLLRRIALEKQTYKAVAKELEISIWACQKRVQRIREKLKQYF